MTTKRLAELLRELTPTEFSDNILLMWMSNCDNTILTDVLLASPEDCAELTELNDAKMLVPHPWDKLYLPYMQAQVAHANGEYDHYANYIVLYNAYRDEYARHIIATVNPGGGEATEKGYYISAYAIAVEHGYRGTVDEWLGSLKGEQGLQGKQGPQGKTGETTLPVARAESGDGIAYTATDAGSGCTLPTVSVADNMSQISAVGKGRQIVFVPYEQNASNAPTLRLNGGEIIPIRLRAPRNQGDNDDVPDATLPVPVGALMRGVPYTMTFCGKYWLVDSQITLMDDERAEMADRMAGIAMSMAAKRSIGFPIVNGEDLKDEENIVDRTAKAYIVRSDAEDKNPPSNGSVQIPTEKRVDEMIRKNIADAPVMSQRAKDLLITILRSAKYETDQSENITNLQIELGSKYNCVIVNNLIGCTSSNPAIGADRNDGYTTTLTAIAGKRLGNVRVKRGNVDITKWVYNPETGIISINKVMDNIVVTAECPDTPLEKTVDLVMTMGQSNISGRGQSEKATPCPAGHGYWYKNPNLSAPSQAEEGLYQIVEPYGNEGAQSSGSPVAALASAYYDATGVPMVCVSNSYGGTPISHFISTGAGTKLQKGIDSFNAAKAYLESQGYTIRHKVVLWCQGESDAEIGTTAEEYTAMFNTMKATLNAECGIEKIAIINIGQYKDSSIDFTTIRDAQFALAANDSDVIMVSDKFRGALMNGGVDSWHYTQSSYDIVGYDAAKNLAHYFITGDKPNVTEYSDADYSEQNVSTYTDFVPADWDYAVVTAGSVLRTYQVSMIDLYQYLGGETTVNVPAYYLHNNIIYSVRVEGRTGTNNSPFYNCTNITDISFDAGVLRTAFGYVQWFYGCKSLKSVSGIPALLDGLSESYTSAGGMYSGCESLPSVVFPKGITYAGSICSGCKSLQSIPEIPTTVTSIIDAFANSGLSHIPNIPNAVTSIARIMNLPGKNHPLTSIGTIGSGVTDMSNAFRYASNLRGTIRIEAKNIASGKMVNAFHADTIANAMFEVPADSTTYETLIATFHDIPADHITTF